MTLEITSFTEGIEKCLTLLSSKAVRPRSPVRLREKTSETFSHQYKGSKSLVFLQKNDFGTHPVYRNIEKCLHEV